jgi:hypothetical protein
MKIIRITLKLLFITLWLALIAFNFIYIQGFAIRQRGFPLQWEREITEGVVLLNRPFLHDVNILLLVSNLLIISGFCFGVLYILQKIITPKSS